MTENYESPPGAPPGWRQRNTADDFQGPSGPPPDWQPQQSRPDDAPPGPPPGHSQRTADDYEPPSGPPPSYVYDQARLSNSASGSNPKANDNQYAPPAGPPPSHAKHAEATTPSTEAPPYHDWTVVPDTALLPPPPQLSNDLSPTANATEAEGEAAYKWGQENPLWQPRPLPPGQMQAIASHAHTIVTPYGFTGAASPVCSAGAVGRWHVRSKAKTRDSCLQTSLPVYAALRDSPLQTERSKTVYFELRVLSVGRGGCRTQSLEEADAGVAIGFFAPPYPGWRLPGWQRGSLAVHGDDGRRYVNDTFGGVDFTSAFRVGETVGIGMTWKPQTSDAPPTYTEAGRGGQSPLAVDVFFTRDGRKDGEWNLHEEMDAERSEGGTKGLDGECDVFAAVGIFGQVEVEVRFSPQDWMFQPPPDKGGW